MSDTNLRAALELAAQGVFSFPALTAWNEKSQKLDKKPAIAGWREAATTDPEQIKRWWASHPTAVPGIELGRSGLFVVDLDRHPGAADGVAAFKAFRGNNPAPRCPTVKTPSGGYHLYFRQPGEPLGNRTGTLPAGVDCRGDGGWTVAPGAVFEQWQWIGDAAKLAAAPPVPTWIVAAIQARKGAENSVAPSPGDVGKRERAYAEAALTSAANKVAASQRGRRNSELNIGAFCLGTMIARGWIGAATVEGRLHDAAVACGLLADDGERAVRSTVKSGIEAGIKEPHADLKEQDNKPKGNGGAPVSTDQKAIDTLAQLGVLAYQKRRLQEAKTLGIPVAALDKLVRQTQAQAEDRSAELPHWQVAPWDAPVDGAALLADIEQAFTLYVFLPTGASAALALWTLHAWTMDAGDISPFIVLLSPTKRCGKTTVLIILLYLTPRSELSSNISPSALFRYVEDIRPTLLIDEADSFMRDNEELRGILNSGHTKAAAHVIRNVEINGEHKPRRFSTWAPKAIATIRELADTLEDRAIMLMLQRKPPGAKVERLRKRDNDEFAVLRRKAARWAADNFAKLADPDPQIPDALNDRAADNWRPLLAIADLADGGWPKRAREAACILSGDGHDVGAINVEMLADIKKAFGESEVLTSADLVAALVADPERPWATWGKNDKPLTQNQLARLLRPFAIISETVHPLGRPHAKGYKRAHFEEAWTAYLPGQNPSSQPTSDSKACRRASADEMGITPDFQSVRETSPHALKNDNLSYSHAGLHACTDRNPEVGAESDSATIETAYVLCDTVADQQQTAKAGIGPAGQTASCCTQAVRACGSITRGGNDGSRRTD
jgi:Protein of unknown function (DUF3631)/Bifunctional DNA primase/polymerase, N-terminal